MKAKVLDKSGKEKGSMDLPEIFLTEIRRDILQKVFESLKMKQPMGTKIGAGAQYSASGIFIKARHRWKGTYGKGISRVPRKIMSRHGSSFNSIGATVASARGGRRAHPPKAAEDQYRKVNKKEMNLAMASAFAGTIDATFLEKKYGVSVKEAVVFNDAVLKLKTKELLSLLNSVFGEASTKLFKQKIIRTGKGKARGRKYKSNAGLLFVISSDEKMNQNGITVKKVSELKLKDLSPNGQPGRLTAYTENAIKEIGAKKQW
jgi:large subunit ribosomal protein L4e